MSVNVSNRLLIFAAAISAGYLLTELTRPLFNKATGAAESATAREDAAAQIVSTGADYIVARRPKLPQSPVPAPTTYIQMDPEDALRVHEEQMKTMREHLRQNSEQANGDGGMTAERIDQMDREGAINL